MKGSGDPMPFSKYLLITYPITNLKLWSPQMNKALALPSLSSN